VLEDEDVDEGLDDDVGGEGEGGAGCDDDEEDDGGEEGEDGFFLS